MCLYIDKVLLGSGILVKPVSKWIRYPSYLLSGRKKVYVTAYRGEPIPDDGVLRPHYFIKQPEIMRELNCGVIHSYADLHRGNFKAYALIPIAISELNFYNPLASRALYIPDLDKSDLKEKRMKLLRGPKENITIQSLTRLFALEGVDLDDYYDYDEEDDDDS